MCSAVHRTAKKLSRLHRVRSLQLDLVRAEEVQAQARVAQEEQLSARIASLAANVAPTPMATGFGSSMAAAAHLRERLHQSADVAARRVEMAEAGLLTARVATREARRDQSAIEKLMAREAKHSALRALRELEAMPAMKRKRHDLC